MARLRSRNYSVGAVSGYYRSIGFGSYDPYSYGGFPTVESCTDTTNSFWHGHWTGGGDFLVNRDLSVLTPNPLSAVNWFNSGGAHLGVGTVRLEGPSGAVPPSLGVPAHPSTLSLYGDAASAIAHIEPTNPVFDLATNIGEIRAEGLPNVPGHTAMESTRLARKAGGEYLNVEFGWFPLVRSIRDFANTVNHADQILKDYSQRANQVVKRSYEWPTTEERQAYACSHVMYPPVGFFTGGGHTEYKFTRKWLEAEFIYYLPVGNSTHDKIARYGKYARKLLGITLSPEVLWNLSPWSWAADWYGNVGDIMHNLSAFGSDSVVLRNAYIMCHSGLTTVDSGTFAGQQQVHTRYQETKSRHVATPFGFGVSDAALSLRQKAIIAALGLSKVR